jgi:hypothetical protein
MTEYEEAREAIAKIFMKENCSADECDEMCIDTCSDYLDGVGCTLSLHFADQILKLPNIAVLSKDQIPPLNKEKKVSGFDAYARCHQDMVKANFKRVIDE